MKVTLEWLQQQKLPVTVWEVWNEEVEQCKILEYFPGIDTVEAVVKYKEAGGRVAYSSLGWEFYTTKEFAEAKVGEGKVQRLQEFIDELRQEVKDEGLAVLVVDPKKHGKSQAEVQAALDAFARTL